MSAADSPVRKKLIEVSIPLEAINAASAREKSIRHGHPSTLHLWWARRPLAACRAVLFAQLVDDPSSWPERFDNDEAKIEAERRRLHKIIEEMTPWEASNDDVILNKARWEIARSVAWGLGEEPPSKKDPKAILHYLQTKAPPIYDPFSGGGSIPLEAQRLGLRAYGSDLNPVAVLIGKALVEIPPKFAGKPPVNPKAREEAKHGALRAWRGAQGLADDVRYYGEWVRDEAEKRIGYLYPKAKLPDGSQRTIVAWFWARTVVSPDPAAKGAMVPLLSSFMLSGKEKRKAWVELAIDPACPNGWQFVVKVGSLSAEAESTLKLGTKTGRGEFQCILTGAPISDAYIRGQFGDGKGSWCAIAVVAETPDGKVYLPSNAATVPELDTTQFGDFPEQIMFRGALGFRVQAYGILRWGDFFRNRQIAALSTFSTLVQAAQIKAKEDARAAGIEGEEYASAVATYLTCALGRAVDYWTVNAMWEPGGEFVIHTFSEMTVPIVWHSAEANPFASGGGGWAKTCLDWVVRVIQCMPSHVGPGQIHLQRAQDINPPPTSTFSFDPPYFDNIGYADLSDAFYVWERKPLSSIFPELARRLATPKEEELVATPARHGGAARARDFFLYGMKSVFERMRESASTDPITIFYSYKEKGLIGQGSGWESFLEAIIAPGWQIDASWPLKTERPTRNRSIGKAALASSIVLVSRKRPEDARVITRADYVHQLKRELPDAVEKIRKAGVGPVDMQQSIIGPGMAFFSQYSKVLEDDDSPMTVKTALSLINRVWEEIENELDAAFDPETQVGLAWFASYGFEARSSGELITLATAKNVSANALFQSGVFKDLKGKACLMPREEMPTNWSPLTDRSLTVWECVQHTARVLNAPEGGGEAAAQLVAEMGSKGADARALAYRLFEIATKRGWASEALIYNGLAQEWPKLEDLTVSVEAARAAETRQGRLALS